jgi:hypothetical protein
VGRRLDKTKLIVALSPFCQSAKKYVRYLTLKEAEISMAGVLVFKSGVFDTINVFYQKRKFSFKNC